RARGHRAGATRHGRVRRARRSGLAAPERRRSSGVRTDLPARRHAPLLDDRHDYPQRGGAMSTTDPHTHMEEAWKLDGNPFPPEGIGRPGRNEPFSPHVFPDETADFKRKLVRGAIQGRRGVGFLWSRGPGGDTGYGKTTLMEAAAREINADLGQKVLLESG